MKRLLKILTAAVAVIVLFTACQQFLDNPEDFLSYWASEVFIKDHSISSAHRPDKAGVPCVGSSAEVPITLSVHNPKGFSFVMPTSLAPAGIVEFKELSPKPEVGTHYKLERTGSGTLKLTYKKEFLEKYEQGSGSLNPTITLKAKDGRVFKKTYTFGIKSNTPPPKPEIIIAKTNTSPSKYVLCLKFDPDEMNNKVAIGSGPQVPVHKDIEKITIKKDSSNNGSSYKLLYNGNGVNSNFQTFDVDSFITHGAVAKLTEDIPAAQDKWVLYYKTNIIIANGNPQTSYTITLSDKEGVVSDEAVATIKASDPTHTVTFSVAGGEGGSITGTYNSASQIASESTVQTFNVPSGSMVTFTAQPNAGWEVDSWTISTDSFTSGGGTGETSATLSNITAPKTVTVRFKKITYKVRFNKNDSNASGNMDDQSFTYGQSQQLTANGFTKTGYTFAGWAKSANGTVQYTNQQSVSNLTTTANDTVNLYAKWTANTYKVCFNKNDSNASGIMNDQTFTYDQSKPLTANGFTKTGYTFTGWATSAGGSVQYTNQQSVSNLTTVANGTVNLYAKWTANTYTVTFRVADGKGGTLKANYGSNPSTMTSTTVQVTNGDSVSFTATPDEGWEFDSWTGVSSLSTTATLSNVTGDKTVTVKFKPGVFDLAGGPDAWKRLKKEVEKTEGAHTIVISGEITATNDPGNNGKISIRRELIIKSSGSSASLNANNLSGIFDVNNKLTLENITLKNGTEPGNRTGAGAYVNSTLIMKGSSAITNCSAHKGGGVYVNNGTLIMQDSSTISSCTATDKGSGVYVAGTFEMKGNARVNTNNDVYLESGKSITVTGSLSHHPAARITPNSYTNGRVLATGAAEKANFKVTPQDGNKYWRFKKQGGEVKFVPAKLKVTFNKIKCVEVEDASSEAEYYWTMKVGKYVIAERPSNSVWDAKKGHIYEFIENGEYNKYFNWDFSYFPISEIPDINTTPKNYIPVYINIMEYDKSDPDDHIGTTEAHLTYDYDNDQWKWEYDGSQSHGNQESNPHITIGDGGEEIFTEEYRTNDGDTDVTITISWKE
ncbi:hypothetical protein E4N87_09175 [Treponema denticola]|uniref:Bacterial repeat domain-containing protein n=1 Tax=Treponema denticola TaxID=158 RepID=A0A9Q9BIS8_TREDN|nr:InlB B-repeat-containing protein [Treponema denticola]UTC90847.1 hypothetical protein E4N87_09175 [Treponema denticola]UTC99801.1 hypothetical protein E4N86_03400 [Treponema denticola]